MAHLAKVKGTFSKLQNVSLVNLRVKYQLYLIFDE